nr:MAG TPA: hypothetical protein [Caudoviricetes sp.]
MKFARNKKIATELTVAKFTECSKLSIFTVYVGKNLSPDVLRYNLS